ncbi:MAG TPA: glycosyltransferase family 9 protein, partial [Burkholderiales bacterium]|nr:glycosyltransferase family 9 protein [Burkholderiales bacterium]
FPGMGERAPDFASLPGFFERARDERFDLVLQLHGDGRFTNPLAVLMGAEATAGSWLPGRYCPDAGRFVPWQEEEPEILKYLRVLAKLGIEAKGTQLEFPLEEADWREFARLGLGDASYAVVHPGAQLPSRRWPAERFAEVADRLSLDGLRIVLTGSAAEAPLTRQVRMAMRQSAVDLAGCTTLGGLAALVSRARLVVANDTGVSHVAAAVRTPSVIVSSGSDPGRWAPLNRQLHRVLWHDLECRPCNHRECPIGHPCALAIVPRQVIAETQRLLQCAA